MLTLAQQEIWDAFSNPDHRYFMLTYLENDDSYSVVTSTPEETDQPEYTDDKTKEGLILVFINQKQATDFVSNIAKKHKVPDSSFVLIRGTIEEVFRIVSVVDERTLRKSGWHCRAAVASFKDSEKNVAAAEEIIYSHWCPKH